MQFCVLGKHSALSSNCRIDVAELALCSTSDAFKLKVDLLVISFAPPERRSTEQSS
jgi:hypothetical protein